MKPACLAFVFALSLTATVASAQTDTTFTYQGELKENGSPASGLHNFDFSLWDAVTSGNQIGATDPHVDVPVVDGKFTVVLDFGAESFDNSNRWLKIIVNGSQLSPRQPITRVPYSIQTRGIFVDEDNRVFVTNNLSTTDSVYARAFLGRHNDNSFSSIFPHLDNMAFINGAGGDYIFRTGLGDGNVGIGTDSPKQRLHNVGDYYGRGHVYLHAFEGDGSDGTAYVMARDDSGTSDIGLRMRTQLNGAVVEAVDILSNGRAIFNDSVFAEDIRIKHSNGFYSRIATAADEVQVINNHAGDISFWLTPSTESLERMTLKPDGKVGIGTSVPDFLLHVDGTAGKPGGGSWSVASDVRLKKNIEPIDNALGTLLRLHGVTFEYIDPDAIHELPGQRIGMIAQEVEKVVPDWVDIRDDGYKTVTHRGFEALTVEALRELSAEHHEEIKSLRAEKDSQIALQAKRLTEVESENSNLRARLDALEQLVEQFASNEQEKTK